MYKISPRIPEGDYLPDFLAFCDGLYNLTQEHPPIKKNMKVPELEDSLKLDSVNITE